MSLDTLTSFFDRLGSGAYEWHEVLAELLLIGFAINWCAGVLHGTRGTRLLRGLLIVLVVATLIVRVAADQLGWPRLELLYRYFIIGMAFIALVSFQPELRRALMRAGELGFLRRGKSTEKMIPALSEAAGYLSRNRFGALIAIQRDVGLANWAENGAQLNAEVSADLLKTIFFPNSALHDLGVIIRGNRVIAAGCQFPVAESGETDASLGSRHRAAVGLSQESDALVLVVSEETGTISIADGGKLTRYLGLDDLEEELESRLADRNATATKTRRRSLSDVWRVARRLLVVAPLTLVIWFLADQASLITADGITLDLRLGDDPSLHTQLVEPDLGEFEVRLRAPTHQIEPLRALAVEGGLEVILPIPERYQQPGTHAVAGEELRSLLTNTPALRGRGVFVEAVAPAELVFSVDVIEQRRLPVEVAAGALRVAVERIEPAEVQVSLPAGAWEVLPEAEQVVIAEAAERLVDQPRERVVRVADVPLVQRVGAFPVLRMNPTEVDVQLRIVAERATRRFSNVPVQAVASPALLQRYELDVADINEWLLEVEVAGDQAVIETLTPAGIRAWVPLTTALVATPGDEFKTLEVQFDLPPGVTVLGPPRVVQVRLSPEEGGGP